MEIIDLKRDRDFLEFLNQNIDTADYRNKYLKIALDLCFGPNPVPISDNTIIIRQDSEWLLFLETQNHLFLYGTENCNGFVKILKERTELRKNITLELMGKFELVYEFNRVFGIETYELIKDRNFYMLNTDKNLLPCDVCGFATKQDVAELAPMMQNYYSEEYRGKNNKTLKDATERIVSAMSDRPLLVYRGEDKIQAFCTIINPDIGILYTLPNYRDKQIGKRILSEASKLLLKKNEQSFLMTDMHSQVSNRIVQRLGYQIIFRQANIKILM